MEANQVVINDKYTSPPIQPQVIYTIPAKPPKRWDIPAWGKVFVVGCYMPIMYFLWGVLSMVKWGQ